MKKILFLSLCVLLLINNLIAQKNSNDSSFRKKKTIIKTFTTKPAKVIFVEAGGNSLLWSANYDARFNKRLDGWGFRVGVGYFPLGGSNLLVLPLGINMLTGSKGHFVETGVNLSFVNAKNKNSILPKESKFGQLDFTRNKTYLVYGISMGYRYQKPDYKGISFRAGIEPILGTRLDNKLVFAITGHLSVGYSF